jgi:hypothetical protein
VPASPTRIIFAGTYVGCILKGEKLADSSVQQSVRIEMVLNRRTAKALDHHWNRNCPLGIISARHSARFAHGIGGCNDRSCRAIRTRTFPPRQRPESLRYACNGVNLNLLPKMK